MGLPQGHPSYAYALRNSRGGMMRERHVRSILLSGRMTGDIIGSRLEFHRHLLEERIEILPCAFAAQRLGHQANAVGNPQEHRKPVDGTDEVERIGMNRKISDNRRLIFCI